MKRNVICHSFLMAEALRIYLLTKKHKKDLKDKKEACGEHFCVVSTLSPVTDQGHGLCLLSASAEGK